jgi:hypothetical protein
MPGRSSLMPRWRPLAYLGICAGALLCGCSGYKSAPQVARLEGSATYHGWPVENGGVSFSPLAGGKAVWAPFVNGRYVAADVPLGTVRVTIHAMRETGQTVSKFGTKIPEEVSIVPDKYRQGMNIEVIGDKLDLNFNLSE